MPTNPPTFNTTEGQTIARELMVLYLNTGTASTPTWSPIGKRVEDSSMEYDWGENTTQDILGDTYSTAKKPIVTQTFDGVKLSQGDAAYEKIWTEGVKNQNPQALTALDLLVVHLYAGTANTAVFAERYPSSMVRPTSIGGEGGDNIEMPLDVTFGGTRVTGTAAKDSTTGAITFSAAS